MEHPTFAKKREGWATRGRGSAGEIGTYRVGQPPVLQELSIMHYTVVHENGSLQLASVGRT
jgi:hypothetical protein